ncbi:hypothetical protein P153DRAFT_362072 [Dothidotthia symphoricarpi CBS 119687]|uniref:Uncharacterized protein n=1 Tax=Dothidotthia symphoricarpi CBS 119687 TaxID=1392245 RepID=A0A6A5ZUI4_9PLEO|nr:uncharacterized protein P153DRAFT_362072 [Dothidotthia symphoricarpi CBS 119687]KAF2123372.1 hypothetical protein P153DRAFT_362072 [Dothidotthia symphoricarpi CBS 119687]
MSYYGVHKAEIDMLVCTTCKTEAFAWLAETFPCPVCGEFKFESLVSADERPAEEGKRSPKVDDGERQSRGGDGNNVTGKKRKRSCSDDMMPDKESKARIVGSDLGGGE